MDGGAMQKSGFKVFLAVLLSIGLILPQQITASAGTYTAEQFVWKVAAQNEVTAGEETIVYFAMDSNPGIYAGSFDITYDPSQLQYKSVNMVNANQGTLMVDNEKTKGTVSVAFVSANLLKTTGNLVAVHFIPLKKAKAHVEIGNLVLSDPDMEDLTVSGSKGADLTIKDLSKTTVTVKNVSGAVQLNWKKITGAEGYYVYRKTGKGKYVKIAKVAKNSTVTCKDKTAKAGKTYTYVVKAYNSVQTGAASTAKSICYLAPVTLSSAKNISSGIRLKWKKSTGASGYYVYRKTGGGSYKKLAKVKGGKKVTYTDKKVTGKKKYTYKIVAYNGKSLGMAKNKKTITRKKK